MNSDIRETALTPSSFTISRFGTLSERDLGLLEPGEWLNDNVISFFSHLFNDLSVDHLILDSFFLPLLRLGRTQDAIFNSPRYQEAHSILIPVHMENHWGLAIYYKRSQRLDLYDSARLINANYLNPFVTQLRRRGVTGDIRTQLQHSPAQENGFDCGVFLLGNAYCHITGNPLWDQSIVCRARPALQGLAKRILRPRRTPPPPPSLYSPSTPTPPSPPPSNSPQPPPPSLPQPLHYSPPLSTQRPTKTPNNPPPLPPLPPLPPCPPPLPPPSLFPSKSSLGLHKGETSQDTVKETETSTRKQLQSLRLISWNINGLVSNQSASKKLRQLRRIALTNKADLICLQETHLHDAHWERMDIVRDALPDFHWTFAGNTSGRASSGVSTAVRKDSPWSPSLSRPVKDAAGHFLLMEVERSGTDPNRILIANIYAKHRSPMSTTQSLLQHLPSGEEHEIILAGDLNSNPLLPSSPLHLPLIQANLSPIPNDVATHASGGTIDHVCVSTYAKKRHRYALHSLIPATKDHSPLVAVFEPRELRKGKLPPRPFPSIPGYLMDDPFRRRVLLLVRKQQMRGLSPFARLEVYKKAATQVARERFNRPKPNAQQVRRLWEIEAQLTKTKKKLSSRLRDEKAVLQAECNIQAVNGNASGTRRTPEWMQALRKPRQTLKALITLEGEVVTSPQAISDAIESFWHPVFKGGTWCATAMEELLRSYSPPKLARPNKPDESTIRTAMKGVDLHSATGPDGIPYGFFRLMADELYPILAEIMALLLDERYATEVLPIDFNHALLYFFPKGEGNLSPKQLRPIAVSNTDYRIIARAVQLAIRPALSSFISPAQEALLHGRSIDNCVASIVDSYYQKLHLNMDPYILMVDFEKAYDNVNREAFLYLLQRLDFPGWITHFVGNLFHNTKYIYSLGGTAPVYFDATKGLKQGCPLSPLLYIVLHDILLTHVTNSAQGKLILKSFMDDDAYVGVDQSPLRSLRRSYDLFCEATGAKLNLKKCIAITPERCRPEEWQSWPDIVSTSSAKYLGVTVSSKLDVDEIWNLTLVKMKMAAKRIACLNLSLQARVAAINCFLLSIPVYMMRFYLAPEHIIQQMYSTVRTALGPRRAIPVHTLLNKNGSWKSSRTLRNLALDNWLQASSSPALYRASYDPTARATLSPFCTLWHQLTGYRIIEAMKAASAVSGSRVPMTQAEMNYPGRGDDNRSPTKPKDKRKPKRRRNKRSLPTPETPKCPYEEQKKERRKEKILAKKQVYSSLPEFLPDVINSGWNSTLHYLPSPGILTYNLRQVPSKLRHLVDHYLVLFYKNAYTGSIVLKAGVNATSQLPSCPACYSSVESHAHSLWDCSVTRDFYPQALKSWTSRSPTAFGHPSSIGELLLLSRPMSRENIVFNLALISSIRKSIAARGRNTRRTVASLLLLFEEMIGGILLHTTRCATDITPARTTRKTTNPKEITFPLPKGDWKNPRHPLQYPANPDYINQWTPSIFPVVIKPNYPTFSYAKSIPHHFRDMQRKHEASDHTPRTRTLSAAGTRAPSRRSHLHLHLPQLQPFFYNADISNIPPHLLNPTTERSLTLWPERETNESEPAHQEHETPPLLPNPSPATLSLLLPPPLTSIDTDPSYQRALDKDTLKKKQAKLQKASRLQEIRQGRRTRHANTLKGRHLAEPNPKVTVLVPYCPPDAVSYKNYTVSNPFYAHFNDEGTVFWSHSPPQPEPPSPLPPPSSVTNDILLGDLGIPEKARDLMQHLCKEEEMSIQTRITNFFSNVKPPPPNPPIPPLLQPHCNQTRCTLPTCMKGRTTKHKHPRKLWRGHHSPTRKLSEGTAAQSEKSPTLASSRQNPPEQPRIKPPILKPGLDQNCIK